MASIPSSTHYYTTEIDWNSILQKQEGGSSSIFPKQQHWEDFLVKFPVTKNDDEQKKKRNDIFDAFDPNGNGYLSLAEIDKGCRDVLDLYKLFDAKKPIMRAYQNAKGIAGHNKTNNNNTKLDGDDYVERSEFRLVLLYLRDYFLLWKLFDHIDGCNNIATSNSSTSSSITTNKDGRIDLNEFRNATPQLEILFGIELIQQQRSNNDDNEDLIKSEFSKIDVNDGGYILFDEFANWALTLICTKSSTVSSSSSSSS
mmetsp:Transcript_50838/g.58756  ORF Transcript_50838/g.58756 Transcript_50838/m.58756 type:complete len:256 (+) Transcript_50838:101-868(+)